MAISVAVLSGCTVPEADSAGESPPSAEATAVLSMPDVVGERLDVAYSDLEALGVVKDDVEILGGGTFGVVNEENWTVCEQRPEAGSERLAGVRLVVDRTCPSLAATAAPSPAATDAGDSASSDADASEESADPDAEASGDPTKSESTQTEAAEAPDSPVFFSTSARGNLKDLYKDLSDTRNAVNEGSMLRLIGNDIELAFNMGQLEALTPPAEIADDWNRGFRQLDKDVDAVSSAITGDASVGQMKQRINVAQSQIKVLLGVVRQLG